MARLKRLMLDRCLIGKSFSAHKMKTRRAAFVVGIAMTGGLTLFLLMASLDHRHPPQGWVQTRVVFNDLVRHVLYNSSNGGGSSSSRPTSLQVDKIVAIQNMTSALRGLPSESHSAMTSPSPSPQSSVNPFSSPALLEFQKAVTDDEKRIFVDLLRVIDVVTTRHNITYFMTYGTMLGSFRHHDMTPWDDDADVAMPYSRKDAVWKLLSGLGVLGYIVKVTADTQYRFFGPGSRLYSPKWPWHWPYVDIDFYKENTTYIELHGRQHNEAIMFPVHRRPFGSLSLNAPRDGLKYLKLWYNSNCSTGLEHRTGRLRIRATIPCSTFSETYPFVHRSITWDQKVMETLKLGSKVLHSVTVDEPIESGWINPFTLMKV